MQTVSKTYLIQMQFGDVFAEEIDRNGVIAVIVVPARQFRGRTPVGPVNLLMRVVQRRVVLRIPPEKEGNSFIELCLSPKNPVPLIAHYTFYTQNLPLAEPKLYD